MHCSLLDSPRPNEILTAHVSLFGLPGNTVDVRPYVSYGAGSYDFTLADYGVQFIRFINTTGEGEAVGHACTPCNAWQNL